VSRPLSSPLRLTDTHPFSDVLPPSSFLRANRLPVGDLSSASPSTVATFVAGLTASGWNKMTVRALLTAGTDAAVASTQSPPRVDFMAKLRSARQLFPTTEIRKLYGVSFLQGSSTDVDEAVGKAHLKNALSSLFTCV